MSELGVQLYAKLRTPVILYEARHITAIRRLFESRYRPSSTIEDNLSREKPKITNKPMAETTKMSLRGDEYKP
jgi:hypothetical protein